eukprot:SAG11_NODE_1930_length_4048_cov_1.413776_3_plen_180_part_00
MLAVDLQANQHFVKSFLNEQDDGGVLAHFPSTKSTKHKPTSISSSEVMKFARSSVALVNTCLQRLVDAAKLVMVSHADQKDFVLNVLSLSPVVFPLLLEVPPIKKVAYRLGLTNLLGALFDDGDGRSADTPSCPSCHQGMVYTRPRYDRYGCDGCGGSGRGARWFCEDCGNDLCGANLA